MRGNESYQVRGTLKILKDAERVGMSVADLNQWQRRRQDEIIIAKACLKQLHVHIGVVPLGIGYK